jgi:hypothetical protein
MERAGYRDVVDEAPAPAQQRLVFQARYGFADDGGHPTGPMQRCQFTSGVIAGLDPAIHPGGTRG